MKNKLFNFLLVVLLNCFIPLQAQSVFFNEIHYDNDGADTDEGVEIAGPAGTDLTGWTVELYNGSGGTSYGTIALSGTIDDEGSGYGALWFGHAGIQNGSPDGLALVDASSTAIQFLSYEGTFIAVDGPASGMESTDIGVFETDDPPTEQSLQLTGTGTVYADFTWTGPVAHSRNDINTGQTFEAVTTTTVFFSSSAASIAEDGGRYDLLVSISNPDADNATTAEVALIDGDAADINNYTTQTVTFPAGSSAEQTVTLSITDDSDIEGDEVLTFELQNIAGGNSAAAGNPSQFNLTIQDNDFSETPNIVINEILQNPDAVGDSDGEWFELYNATDSDIDINGWTIKDDGSDSHLIDNGGPLIIPVGGYLVLGNNDTLSVNGGAQIDYMYPSNWYLSNGDDEVVLVFSDGVTEVDRVNYDGGTNFPDPTGKSMELNNPANDNNDGSNWAESTAPFGDGDMGTPGSQNSTFVNAIDRQELVKVASFKLYANYPNPFNPFTTLRFDVPRATDNIELAVFDVLGKKVKTLYSGNIARGQFTAQWNGANQQNQPVPSGVYFGVLKTKNFSQTIKMMLLK